MTDPCIITVAITGSVPRKEHTPAVPITVPEQIESTHAAWEAGAAIAHGRSRPGERVDLRARTNVLAVISNCPQVHNPCNAYNPTPVRALVFAPAAALPRAASRRAPRSTSLTWRCPRAAASTRPRC